MTLVNTGLVDFEKNMIAVQEQNRYLDLINDRGDKVEDELHKAKVLKGYAKIMNLLERAYK